jgi:RNA polymerase sigma-70 factor (ECF subfamily)
LPLRKQEDFEMQTSRFSERKSGRIELEFEEIVERYYQSLYQFALSLTGSEADACDLTQQTFFTWQIKGGQLRDPSKVRAWLFTTMHRGFLQTKRREIRFPHYDVDQVDCELPYIPPHCAEALDCADVMDALAKVDDAFRAPLALFYLEDCAYKDIAETLNLPLGTVKSRISRGINQLKMLLSDSDCRTQTLAA